MSRWSLLFAAFGCFALFNAHAAECSRENVDYYLSKGFSPGQITRLCTTAGAARGDTAPDKGGSQNFTGNNAGQAAGSQKPAADADTADYESLNQPSIQSEANNPATYLSLAIDSDAVFVDDDKISFRHTTCTRTQGRIEACPDMTLEIELTGLQITDTGRGSNGGGTIEVQGNIERQINNYSGLSPAERRVADRLYTERHAVIPVKKGVAVEEAHRALQSLVENANPPLIVSE